MLYILNFWQGTWRWQYPYVRIIASVGWKQIRSFLVAWCSALKRADMNEWYAWQSCVGIEGYSITSSSPPSKYHIAELPFLVSLSSGVSAPHSPVLFRCEVACLSLTVWAACLAWSLSRRFFNLSLLCSAVSATRQALSILFLRRRQSSCSYADLRALLT